MFCETNDKPIVSSLINLCDEYGQFLFSIFKQGQLSSESLYFSLFLACPLFRLKTMGWSYCSSLSHYTQQPEPVERWFILFLCFSFTPHYVNVFPSDAITACQSRFQVVPTASWLNFPCAGARPSALWGPADFLYPGKNFHIRTHRYYPLYLSSPLLMLAQPPAPAEVVTWARALALCLRPLTPLPTLRLRALTSCHHSRPRLRLSLPRKLPRLPHDLSFLFPFSKHQKCYCVCH